MDFSSTEIRSLIHLALEEDIKNGDITSELCISPKLRCVANVVAREKLIVCGLPIVPVIIEEARFKVQTKILKSEGLVAENEEILIELSGGTKDLLALERTILNFLQRLCGIATFTNTIVKNVSRMQVLDTRKTMPGWRALDKYAVKTGGGRNHRGDLSERILVKNNHVDAHPNGLHGVLTDIAHKRPKTIELEVEVRNMEELRIASSFNPEIIMLDNFSNPQILEAMNFIQTLKKRPYIEVSGSVTPERLKSLEDMGVDGSSLGALTTRANNVDISMRFVSHGER